MFSLTQIAAGAALVLIGLFTIGAIFARLYNRATKEKAFVRTGFGGQRVIMDGGALVFPVLHEVIPVNMNTLRLEVRRAAQGALITKDRMRVDVGAEFYVRVKPTKEAIADAAQTLGRRTLEPMALKELVEGKFVDALRAVAAEMAMEELHEQRVNFVQKVQTAVSEDLLKNGLELESVSLTALDQTDREFFNPQNAFDAQGLTKLTEEIEARRKQRNDIEQDTEVEIASKNLTAEQQTLEIKKQEEYARLDQQREIEVRRANQEAEIAKQRAEQKREADQAEIVAAQRVDQSRIESERLVEAQQIAKEQAVREADIERQRSIETAEVEKQKSIELSDQDRNIAIAEKSRDQSEAEAEADRARALSVEAAEQVETVRENAKAERLKLIELVEARKEAERQAISITVAADAEKAAAIDQAEAVRTLAEGRAKEATIEATGQADAEKLRAEAARLTYEVEAGGQRALNEAENLLASEVIAMRVKLALIENLDEIIRESVKPIEAIDAIKILQVDGLAAGVAGGGVGGDATTARAESGAGGGNLADEAVNAALRYRAQAPLVDSLLTEIGIDGGDITGLTQPLRDADAPRPVPNGSAEGVPDTDA
ncbi:MAG: flotillin domain-containing protein [Myxococcota bacterium]